MTIVENKYGWEEEEVATFMFFYRLVYWVGLWAGVPLLTRIFQLSDNIIAIIASITTAAGAHVHKHCQKKKLIIFLTHLQDSYCLCLPTQLCG